MPIGRRGMLVEIFDRFLLATHRTLLCAILPQLDQPLFPLPAPSVHQSMVLATYPTYLQRLTVVFVVSLCLGITTELAASTLDNARLNSAREDAPALVLQGILGNRTELIVVMVGTASTLPVRVA